MSLDEERGAYVAIWEIEVVAFVVRGREDGEEVGFGLLVVVGVLFCCWCLLYIG